MTKIVDILAAGPSHSFEFFPPKTPAAERLLEQTLLELEPLHPSFVSVTYGAGGSTREMTHDIVTRINRDTSLTAMAHLTCAAHTRDELAAIITRYDAAGVENILALGGDPPKELNLPPGELAHATDLVALVRELGDFSVGVAVHPEGHPASANRADDRQRQAEKLAIADFGISQFFFEPHVWFEFLDDLDAARGHHAGDPGDHAGTQREVGETHGRDVGRGVSDVARRSIARGRRRRRRDARRGHRSRDGVVSRACARAASSRSTSTRSTDRPRPARSTTPSDSAPDRSGRVTRAPTRDRRGWPEAGEDARRGCARFKAIGPHPDI